MKLQDFGFRIWDEANEKYLKGEMTNTGKYSIHDSIGYAVGVIGDCKPIYTLKAGIKDYEWGYGDYEMAENLYMDEDGCEIELWTGYFDKNGNKIYEGDILYSFEDCPEDEAFKYKVVFKEGAFYLVEFGDDGEEYDEDLMSEFLLIELEIVGNIHENAELLK